VTEERRKAMLVHRNNCEGTPPRLYRSPKEIEEDISFLRSRATEIEGMLSVRNLLVEMVTAYADTKPELWIPELESAVGEARRALDALSGLNRRLGELREELCEVRCLMRN
jgi:hypothetical protein